ncbi:uncharacterized protein LOC132062283 [Lycium ferocissimum]|uniref:uncharacterized protein LOC132062283 n=1 Tax=Lycium ferocissimum TaxID=112874 RepID=UPI002815DB4D|nr:uncharacterized protein LOC132062283 [Lycium ferocissimum]
MIVKVLAIRLQVVMPSITCEVQAGLILGRKIADNIILAHELIKPYSRKHISHRAMIKIDLLKAYDFVEWPFLEQVMTELGFLGKFHRWIMPKDSRKGTQFPLFLFAISMEYLSIYLNELKHVKEFKYHPRCAKLGITHLSFTNDLLLFSRGDPVSVRALHKCFLILSEASGLQPNLVRNLWDGMLGWLQRPKLNVVAWEQYVSWAVANAKGKTLQAKTFKIIFF